MRAALLAAVLVIASGTVAQAAASDGAIVIPNTAVAPAIDGDLTNPAWKNAIAVPYDFDLRLHQTSGNKTTAYLMTDGKNIYVGFDAKQAEPLTANQRTNNVGLDTDDEVQIDLWPSGQHGFAYKFIATPNGTHYQFSSENNSYEPAWSSAGKILPGNEFTVTMRIPVSVMRGAKQDAWRVQLIRMVAQSREDIVWLHGSSQQDHNDITYAGYLNGMPRIASARPQPRFGIYGLAQAGSANAGGNTSRSGADIAIPLTAGTSLVATFHPDFSNVEADQQTISPSAFRRSYNELRPFFTQGGNFYNHFSCVGCPGIQELYTPSIPTPRTGYAIEGKEGNFSLAGFDAVGFGRTDAAQTLHWSRPDNRLGFSVQRVAVDLPGVHDDVITAGGVYDNLVNHFVYFNYGSESGNLVANGSDAQRYDFGGGFYTPTSFIGGSIRKIGTYYNPYDGFVASPGIAGYDVNGSKDFLFDKKAKFKRFSIFGEVNRYHPASGGGGFNQADQSFGVELVTQNRWRFHAETGAAYFKTSDGVFNPITQNFYSVTYHTGTSTPTQIALSRGRFGPGMLNSWMRTTTMRAGPRGTLSFELDNTDQFLDSGTRYTQWLERASYAYQINPESSVAIGVRKITGYAPYLTGTSLTTGTNLSFAYHTKFGPYELYAAYGNAGALNTRHDFLIKLIKYVGAQKGT